MKHPKSKSRSCPPLLQLKGQSEGRVLPDLTDSWSHGSGLPNRIPTKGEGPPTCRADSPAGKEPLRDRGKTWGKYIYFSFLLLADTLPKHPTGQTQLEAVGREAIDSVCRPGQGRVENENTAHSPSASP